MAKLSKNSPLNGISGTLGGDLLFSQMGGKTIVSMKPQTCKKSSSAQKKTRGKFKEATEFSKAQMKDPARKEYYRKIAKRLKLPNAYTAAITEYMRGPVVDHVRLEQGKGGKLKLNVRADKKGFKIKEVKVIRRDKENNERIVVASKMSGSSLWLCELGDLKEKEQIEVFAFDGRGNYGRRRV